MKKTVLIRVSVTLNIVVISTLIFMAFKPIPPQSNQIDLATAKGYCQRNTESTKAVYVDKQMIADLNNVLAQNGNAKGLRIYFGKDQNGASVNILVPTAENGKDDTRYILKSTNAVNLCPHICDAESELTK